MSSGYSGRLWACPFFRWDKPGQVRCEGGAIRIPDRDCMSAYLDAYCDHVDGWRRCTIAQAMEAYYDYTEAKPPE